MNRKLPAKMFWWIWLLVLFLIPYTPIVSPYGYWNKEILGIPVQLALWILFTILMIVSIWIFVAKAWTVSVDDE